MKTSWTCRALGIFLGALAPTISYAQEPFYNAPNAGYGQPALDYQPANLQNTPNYFAEDVAPRHLPSVNGPGETVSAASYYNLLERVEALEAEKAEDAYKEVEILSKPTQKWSGRVHFDYWHFPNESALPNFLDTGNAAESPPDFIGFRRLRYGVAGDINETMNYKIEMEFASPDSLAFKDAYLGWTELPWLHTVLLGNQKRPYGLDHLNSSRYNVFMERPFVIEAFNQDARRLGLQSYGVSDNEAWNWRFGTFAMKDLSKPGHQYADNYQSEIAGRLANTIWYDETSGGRGYAHWAVSGSAAFPSGGGTDRFLTRPESRTDGKWFDTGVLGASNYQLLGLEGVVNLGALSVVGEYQTVHANRTAAPDTNFGGGYVYVAYWLTGEYTPWERDSGTLGRTKPLENFWLVNRCDGCRSYGWGAWQIAARYSYCDFTDQDIFGGVGESATLGVNWWWNPHARVQFNYINGRISDRIVAGAPSTEGWYDALGLRFMVDF
ncbi:OprO/OprP family phosphate-selective porin [Blastopirellula marina]|uniref:Porin n=1 Tax=Blastopirellula marina TaxID=124 RepID=A0A2S8G1I6_9BACT|nr:porin [Blastopirellula marina]PQO37994.1 porin [Blastopirellula marina]PTL44650.1 porin [Blastopirellula marina]